MLYLSQRRQLRGKVPYEKECKTEQFTKQILLSELQYENSKYPQICSKWQ